MDFADALEIVINLAKATPDLTKEQVEAISQVEDFAVNECGDD